MGRLRLHWKVAIEAFAESYHVEGAHPQLLKFAEFYTWSKAEGGHAYHGFDERDPSRDLAANNTILRSGSGDDARVSIAKLPREVYDTVNAATTLTFVNAAERLVHELAQETPADQVMAHFFESARRDDEARGVVWPSINPEHAAKAGIAAQVFANLSLVYGVTFCLVYQIRPYGTDPNHCIFEASFMQRYPEGGEPDTDWSSSPTTSPDVAAGAASGLRRHGRGAEGDEVGGFRGSVPNPKQEIPISNFNHMLARYVGRRAAAARLRPQDQRAACRAARQGIGGVRCLSVARSW